MTRGMHEAQAAYDAREPEEREERETCSACRGSGEVWTGAYLCECSACMGTGEVRVPEAVVHPGPVVKDGKRLHAYLVRLATEAVGDLSLDERRSLRERMAQAAQCIVCEVAEIERDAMPDAARRGGL